MPTADYINKYVFVLCILCDEMSSSPLLPIAILTRIQIRISQVSTFNFLSITCANETPLYSLERCGIYLSFEFSDYEMLKKKVNVLFCYFSGAPPCISQLVVILGPLSCHLPSFLACFTLLAFGLRSPCAISFFTLG